MPGRGPCGRITRMGESGLEIKYYMGRRTMLDRGPLDGGLVLPVIGVPYLVI